MTLKEKAIRKDTASTHINPIHTYTSGSLLLSVVESPILVPSSPLSRLLTLESIRHVLLRK